MSLCPGARCHTVLDLQEHTSVFINSRLVLPSQGFNFSILSYFLLYMKNVKRKKTKRIAVFHFTDKKNIRCNLMH